jgi:hypothetical protein
MDAGVNEPAIMTVRLTPESTRRSLQAQMYCENIRFDRRA